MRGFFLYKENPRIVRGFRNRLMPMSKNKGFPLGGKLAPKVTDEGVCVKVSIMAGIVKDPSSDSLTHSPVTFPLGGRQEDDPFTGSK